jgi:alkanesulfonate monooxygenase SsuD/methylene tetrahydromethanopterin reductase-like flavin-dependent oxidoreductase (luciferase family)
MDIALGLPALSPDLNGRILLDWARKADEGPFSSLSILDRLAYHNLEPLMALSAASSVTHRVRLMTAILISALRNPGILAKQAASLDAFSAGRLTLGLGIGGRDDDFRAAPANMRDRGKRFDEQLSIMKRIWSGQPVEPGDGVVGPEPVQSGGPELLIGAINPAAIQRVGRWGTGYLAGWGDPGDAEKLYGIAQNSWKDANRPGRPRFVAGAYIALGPKGLDKSKEYVRGYYRYRWGDAGADRWVSNIRASASSVKDAIQEFANVGVDELILVPCVADLEEIDRLTGLLP